MQDLSIVNYLSRNNRKISEIVDETFFRLLEGTSDLDELMPLKNYMSRKLLMLSVMRHRPTVANILSEEQSVPISRPRATLEERTLDDLKMGKQFVYTAYHFEMMHELQRYENESGPMAKGMRAEIEKLFFGIQSDLVAPILDRLTLITLQIMTTGQSVFTDPITGARVELVYPDTLPALLLPALTGGARWNQPTTCTPLANLEAHARSYFDVFGEWPDVLTMRLANFRQIGDSTEAKISRRMAIGADAATPSTEFFLEDEVIEMMIKQRTRVKKVKLFDAQYSEDVEGLSEPVDRPFLEDNRYFFGKYGNVIRAFVPCIEKNLMPGVFLHHKVVEEVPRKERSVSVANGLPVFIDSRRITARQVA
jgi:hypothetical protein